MKKKNGIQNPWGAAEMFTYNTATPNRRARRRGAQLAKQQDKESQLAAYEKNIKRINTLAKLTSRAAILAERRRQETDR